MAKKKHVWEPGVPAGWCVERKTSKSKFAPGSFRNVLYNRKGKRATSKTGAVRGVTVACPKGHWDPKAQRKGYKTKGVCKVGTRVQRVLTKPGHYGCGKRRKRKG